MGGDRAKMGDSMKAAARVGRLLVERGWTLGTAESCTGGLIGHWITNIPGSSAFFVGGVAAYADRVKEHLLGVSEALLAAHGAVSQQVALAMAEGIRRLLRTDVGIAVTGVAGPTGGTPEKPVGTVFIALSSLLGDEVHHHLWSGDRMSNKRDSALAALTLVEGHLTRQTPAVEPGKPPR